MRNINGWVMKSWLWKGKLVVAWWRVWQMVGVKVHNYSNSCWKNG
jgi:hypothetical protein